MGAPNTPMTAVIHTPGNAGCDFGHFPTILWARKWGEGSFIISDINNSVNSVAIPHLKISHSAQHRAFGWAGFPSQLRSCLKSAKAPRGVKMSLAL